jgi:hypothetical protein
LADVACEDDLPAGALPVDGDFVKPVVFLDLSTAQGGGCREVQRMVAVPAGPRFAPESARMDVPVQYQTAARKGDGSRFLDNMNTPKAICCFCGATIPTSELVILKIVNPDPRAVVQEQLFYAHPDCVRDRFHADAVLPVLARSGSNAGACSA